MPVISTVCFTVAGRGTFAAFDVAGILAGRLPRSMVAANPAARYYRATSETIGAGRYARIKYTLFQRLRGADRQARKAANLGGRARACFC